MIMNRLVSAPSAVPTQRGEPADRAQRLLRDAVEVGRAGHQPLRGQPAGERGRPAPPASTRSCVGLLRRSARRSGRRCRARNATASTHDDQQPPAARDRQHPAEQPHAAVEHRGEDQPAEDDQQRLDQQHDQRDRAGRCRTTPPRACNLARGSPDRAPRCGLAPGRSHARRGVWSLICGLAAGWSEVPARPERKRPPPGQRVPASRVPSSEKVMNSARPPIFSHGTGPPRPRSLAEREAAVGRTGRDCRPSGRRGRPGCVIGP